MEPPRPVHGTPKVAKKIGTRKIPQNRTVHVADNNLCKMNGLPPDISSIEQMWEVVEHLLYALSLLRLENEQ
ncbi:hypothetical protein TNCV_2226511 [Trichonephila clavipes]|nr:hypothetical protein TNCV_2226511 [Trichonephila clavipes]